MTDLVPGRQRRGDGDAGGPCARSEGPPAHATRHLSAGAGLRPDTTAPPIPTSVGRCSGPRCGQEIRWAMTEQGRRMPLDYEPDPAGNVVIVTVDGKHRARVLSGAELPAQQQAWMPHHRTCIDSEDYKRRAHTATPKCRACGSRMDSWLAEHGYRYHVNCEPPGDMRDRVNALREEETA